MDAGSSLVRSLESLPASRRRQLLVLLNELVRELTGSERLYLDAESEQAKASPANRRTRRKVSEAKS
jgi:hypothetical protein